MKTINLTKFGFVRSPEDDFTDDGNRFTCYRVGDVRVSKLTYGEEVFISGRYDGSQTLNYEEYSKLPHYLAMSSLNGGVFKSSLTDDDLIKFYEDCVAYDREYKDALSKIVYPTVDEIANAERAIIAARKAELADLKKMAADNIDKFMHLREYDSKQFKEYYLRLERISAETDSTIENRVKDTYKTLASRNLIANLDNSLKPSIYYRECKSLLE